MNGNRLFLDTNILIYLLKGNKEIEQLLDRKDFIISFVTELELLSFPLSSYKEQRVIETLLSDCIIIEINKDIKLKTIAIRKKFKLKLPDAIICATSIFMDLPLLTADKQLFHVDEANILFYETNI